MDVFDEFVEMGINKPEKIPLLARILGNELRRQFADADDQNWILDVAKMQRDLERAANIYRAAESAVAGDVLKRVWSRMRKKLSELVFAGDMDSSGREVIMVHMLDTAMCRRIAELAPDRAGLPLWDVAMCADDDDNIQPTDAYGANK